ncbi:Core-2/I-branching beta-1,6-N-acetylglucosaminyltransferase family protein [Heracleum sosnowskyi]|uniref:Core-2/I-branching beta-1,6-N-acetylglucosaminyltransferase family protein n=1 Tax=Heracleum sosnowskyi TaxID=360622 RepID=A0AAD8H989_9APIA|nr:Core-2/I-branching beta-1,6-N-acetylglucosaminyltransferase family protein [Heracleum sosnowskyi]
MMQARLVAMEEGKEPSLPIRSSQPRALPMRLLQFFLIFLGLAIAFMSLSMFMSRHYRFDNVIIPVTNSRIHPCFRRPNDFKSWIKPPLNVWHRMNDSELFWRATFDPQIKSYPFKRVPKLAFMFLTRGPLPMAPLWDRFFKGHEKQYSIYVHTLPMYNESYPSSSVFYRRQIPSQVAEWGRMSMCDAERRLLANALLDISNEWFILLSEACIPLQSFPVVYLYISKSRFSFMEIYDDPGPFGRGRYNPNMEPVVNLTDWRKGSQWFEINRKLAVDIVGDDTFYPLFEKFCRPACYVDEHYFQTMLSIRSPHLLANRTLTWVDWSRGGAHPGTFGKDDMTKEFFKKIIEGQTCIYNNQPSSACLLFARKIAPNALPALLEHSSEFFGY